jgi:hypothetical protein
MQFHTDYLGHVRFINSPKFATLKALSVASAMSIPGSGLHACAIKTVELNYGVSRIVP